MKVLHVIPSLSAVHGGPSRAMLLIERALAGQGVAVETATTDDDGAGRRLSRPRGQPLAENDGVHWYFAKALEFYKPSPEFARWIAANARNYDLLHLHALFSFTTTAAARAALRAGVPYIVRPLGTLNDYGMQRRRPALKALSFRFIEAPLLRSAAAVHFTSEDEALQARSLGIAMKEAVIPLAVETPDVAVDSIAAQRLRAEGSPVLLFLSRLDPKKNVEGLLDAVALLLPQWPQLHLIVAGSGPDTYVAQLKQRATALGIAPRVRWAGHLEGDAKAAVFAAADAFVLPSHSENFGIAAAEALAAGLPCVLGEGVAIAQEVAAAGAGVAVGPNPARIAEGVRLIIANGEQREAMGARARQLAQERYSVPAMGARLKHLYTEILGR